jgi:V8-like Glu-specific endopeptidase
MKTHHTARRTTLASTLGLCLSLTAGACALDAEPAPDTTEEHVPRGSWEPVANPVRIAAEVSDSLAVLRMDDETQRELADRALGDRTWLAGTGERYEALYVSPSGKAYGRLGAAPAWPEPDAQVGAGSLGWIPDSEAPGAVVDAVPELRDSGEAGEAPDGALYARITTDISNDRRSRFGNVASLTSVPLRMVGVMTSNGDTDRGGCTGTKIGPRAVLTASHCVMNEDGDIRTSGWFNPGQTNTTTPNGSFRWSGVYLRDWRIHRRYDYAIVFLQDNVDAVGLGWLGVAYWNSAAGYSGRGASLHGYPCGPARDCGQVTEQRCAASPRRDKRCDGWMYSHSTNLWSNSYRNDGLLQYDHDMSSGQSGSSVYVQLSPGDRRVVAVNTHSWNGVSMGARFRSYMWNDVCTWIAAVPSQFGTHGSCN